jgi:AbrB family looped-hinge helix DNA binding protein
MTQIVTLDSAGRVVIPRGLRDELRLQPGDTLALESDGERVVLRPVRSKSAMRKEHGIWVFRSGRKMPATEADEALAELRRSRKPSLRGPRP